MADVTGSADVPKTGGDEPPAIVTTGECLRKTMRRLRMSDNAKQRIAAQAADLVERTVAAYAKEFGPGEVGATGTARVAPDSHAKGFGPAGLLYGRIQSGKTGAMIASTALAIDNGFRVVVVLTTNFVELVKQTKDRFNDLERALIHASTEPEAWEADVTNIRKHVAGRGLVVVCAKDIRHLENVSKLLDDIGASQFPALILDDEADQASLDNNVRRRSLSKDPDDVAPTKIHECIAALRTQLHHHVFLQVTATPYALLLQRVDSPMRPKFTFLLEPGDGYTGGEHFFSEECLGDGEAAIDPKPPIIFVPEEEWKEIDAGPMTAPSGLEKAITFFLVSAAAQLLQDPDVFERSQNFLCHTSHKKSEHDKLYKLISAFLSAFEDELTGNRGTARMLVNWAYEELRRTLPEVAPLQTIVDDIVDRLPRRKIRLVNSEGKSTEEARGAPNFIVGGNIVGRGLTIDNLLVTYYLRKPRVSQMDTMLQHARMFGYRGHLMRFTRVFLPESLAIRFARIHDAEADLRKLLPSIDALDSIPVQVVGELRATRYGVLDTGSVASIRSGQHMFPTLPSFELGKKEERALEAALSRAFGGDELLVGGRQNQPREVDISVLIDLVAAFPVEDDDWDKRAITSILRTMKQAGMKGWLTWREMSRGEGRTGPELGTGAASGEELTKARSRNGPTFHAFYQRKPLKRWRDRSFWYPTLVFPDRMPTQVYNKSGEDE